MKLIVEYYKYHEDVPRAFILPEIKLVNNWYDKKRKIKYKEVVKQLKASGKKVEIDGNAPEETEKSEEKFSVENSNPF